PRTCSVDRHGIIDHFVNRTFFTIAMGQTQKCCGAMRRDASASPSVLITVRGSATRNPGTSKDFWMLNLQNKCNTFVRRCDGTNECNGTNISSPSTSSFGKSNYGFLLARPVDSQTVEAFDPGRSMRSTR